MTNKEPTAQAECKYCEGIGYWYGVAPHIHDMEATGSIIGSTKILPKKLFPSNFKEDPECEGCGTYSCTHCTP